MSGRLVTGVRLVLADCTDPTREDEFNARYDTYAAALTEPGYFLNARRFTAARPELATGVPRYLTVYDIALDEPGAAWPLTAAATSGAAAELDELLAVSLRATYARFRPSIVAEPPSALTVILSDVVSGEVVAAVAERAAAVDDTEVYALVEGAPEPPVLLELRASPGQTVSDWVDLAPRLRADFRLRRQP